MGANLVDMGATFTIARSPCMGATLRNHSMGMGATLRINSLFMGATLVARVLKSGTTRWHGHSLKDSRITSALTQ